MDQDSGNSKSLATLVVLHGKRSYTISDLDPQTTTVGDLKTKIFDESSVPQSLQKLIVKGELQGIDSSYIFFLPEFCIASRIVYTA